ncbi:kelch repeat-containing protein [Luteolibacter sp. Populi]|uniref:kelch repeat-containing protein n=1 Tax=Luteolibacter sp. Populi TaxID=3230487 RepID=UPI0034660AA2
MASACMAGAADVFVFADTLSYARREHTATLLPNGKVLVSGGIGNSGTSNGCELYNPATSTWGSTGDLSKHRRNHSATLLGNGRVLVAGGFDDYNIPLQAELYDPSAGTWSAAGSLVNGRNAHTATLLDSGKVLVTGGRTTADGSGTTYPTRAEVYDPVANAWSATGFLATGRANHTATLLQNGKVLITGGIGTGGYSTGCMLYDPVPGTWSATGALATGRAQHTATLLPDGKVLVAGGFNGAFLTATELYNPLDGTWSTTGAMTFARRNHTATLLPDGRILIAGGASSGATYPTPAEFYGPASGTCSPGPDLFEEREFHTATLLPEGEVVLAGGSRTGFLSVTELYDTPNLTRSATSLLTESSVRLGGNVTNIGSASVTGRGVVFAPAAINSDPKLGGPGATAVAAAGTTGSFTVNLSELSPGTAYRFRAYAMNAVGTGYSTAGSFTTLTALEAWRKKWYGITTDTGDAADGADPHGTGLPNLVVFAFLGPGHDPAKARPAQLPQAGWAEGAFGYSFSPPAGVTGILYEAEQSATLDEGSWLPVPDTGSDGGYRFVLSGNGPKSHFLRLKVTRP